VADQTEAIRQKLAELPPDEASEVLERLNKRLDNMSLMADATILEVQKEKAEKEHAAKYDELSALLKNPRMNRQKIAELTK
jgi:cation transport regulator ChaC